MCGIVGVAGNLNVLQEKVLRTLLILDSIRGEDSTGIASVGKFANPSVSIAKSIGNPFELFETKSYETALRGPSRAIIGHNRYATSGKVNRQNAHPFENPTLVGVHNGTIKNKYKFADHMDYVVDSENLYHHMHKKGLEHTLDTMDGAWALVWWNKVEETLNFLRNRERPLFICTSATKTGEPDGDVVYWASESWMLDVALSRHGVMYTEPELLDVDKHIKIHIGQGGKLGKPYVKDAPGTYKGFVPTTKDYLRPVANNVVALPGKQETSQYMHPDRLYLRKKDVVVELMDAQTDDHGCKFIPLFDNKQPYYDIRLYPQDLKDPIWDHIPNEASVDIKGWTGTATPGKGYYIVNPKTVKAIVPLSVIAPTVKGPSGQQLTEQMFYKLYPACSWCSSPLEFGAANKYSTAAECFCPDCATNNDVREYVKF